MRGSSARSASESTVEDVAWRVGVRLILFVVALALLLWLISLLRVVLIQVLLAVIFSAGMTPLVDRLTEHQKVRSWRWRPPRALVVLTLYFLFTVALVLLGAAIAPPLVNEVEELAQRLPALAGNLQKLLDTLPPSYGIAPDIDLGRGIAAQLGNAVNQLTTVVGQALVVVRVAIGIVGGALDGILTLILALYMTADSRRIRSYVLGFLPSPRQSQAERVVSQIGLRLGGWVRGQIFLSAIVGAVTLLGLSALGVRYAVLLAIIAAVGEAIPLLGPIISAVPAVAVALIHSPLQALLTLGLYIAIQQLENHLLVPKVMERAVALHPLVVILALLAGGELLGVSGAILSVPVVAALSVVVDEVRRERMGSQSEPSNVERAAG